MSEIKFKPILGALPETLSEWWTEEDWMRHNEYVARLKEQEKYLTEGEEITIVYNPESLKIFEDNKPPEEQFKNFGMMIPKGSCNDTVEIKYNSL